jgi:hypothetical protein
MRKMARHQASEASFTVSNRRIAGNGRQARAVNSRHIRDTVIEPLSKFAVSSRWDALRDRCGYSRAHPSANRV